MLKRSRHYSTTTDDGGKVSILFYSMTASLSHPPSTTLTEGKVINPICLTRRAESRWTSIYPFLPRTWWKCCGEEMPVRFMSQCSSSTKIPRTKVLQEVTTTHLIPTYYSWARSATGLKG
ncbi:hypothetical protein CC1G_15448 [Coprinopsis cinerea okayama7|uniref:Uncharacterized protein n=1 Tax=Coprinopsis cinerea (strain Okayama-7 / 130 / ATCC MYA-4618 / FGSC 9003) TaxID=240176 RepID=D6RQV0_COPC7|nr:hypothetical protein CC1G_15448 [Coprinopsis cinerea okayama7\|eukprot:XP_002910171.1 hypothetical protein CC1G_15448 [Coprinopsis cinerea okayama7\